jgi:serine protease Do
MKRAALIALVGAACASAPAPTAIGIAVKRADAGGVVAAVASSTPAAAAGVEAGDVLLRYGGEWVLDERQAHALMLDTAPGSTVELELLREGKVHRVFISVE